MSLIAALAAPYFSTGCAAPHVRQPLEEEPFVLSPGPPLHEREEFAAHPHPPHPPGTALATTGVVGARTAIELVGPAHNVPLVHARIAGQPTSMLVDTGAFDHLLEGWFARELQDAEPSGAGSAVTDHANRKVPMERWSPVTFALDGWGPLAPIRPLATDDLAQGPRALGIGGILSPQRLAHGTTVVLDFPAGEMVATDDTTASLRLGSHARSLGVALRCGTAYIFAATVDHVDARLLLDTGSFTTDLKASSAPGRALGGRTSVSREVYAIGGPVGTRALHDAELAVGELSTKLDLPVVADRPHATRCASDGVLGMDVLARCVVAVDEMKMRVSCD